MWKRLGLVGLLFILLLTVNVTAEVLPERVYLFSGRSIRNYESDSLRYKVEKFSQNGCVCYLTKIWMRDPGKQIIKATAEWEKNIMLPGNMAKKIPEAALVINGSGYVSPRYPWIPENYPGSSEDYYYTPLGSLTITDGTVFRNLEGVPYYGLTLEKDGLHMYAGIGNDEVLSYEPTQTWSFYIQCPMIKENEDILPEDWHFADQAARRTVIAKADDNNYLILTVTNEGRVGLTLRQVNAFLLENFDLEWAYDLDGGPSSALMVRRKNSKTFKLLFGGTAKDADVMGFRELP